MAVDVLLGLQWGDEGKGKIVDYISKDYDVVCRFQGGPNAGHTILIGDSKHVLHTIPSGVFRDNCSNLIGNGVVIDPITFKKEIEGLETARVDVRKNLYISKKAHLILPTHRMLDAASEASKGKDKIGSTLRGIGPTYMDKTGRNGLRVGDTSSKNFKKKYQDLKDKHLGLLKLYPEVEFDLEGEEAKWLESLDTLRSITHVNGEYFVNEAIWNGNMVLAEGAQGSMLDIDFGTYPFVTSSNTITAGVCNGLGIAPNKIHEVIGITKAYCTRVGAGPFPTELHDASGEELRRVGHEFGATTGRPRRCGWIDIPQLKYTIMLNGVTQLVITKLDCLNDFDTFMMCSSYEYDGMTTTELPYDLMDQDIKPVFEEVKGWKTSLDGVTNFTDLPDAASDYILQLEHELEVPVSMISTGPERKKLINKPMQVPFLN